VSDRRRRRGFSTEAVHAGQPPDPATGAVMTPVYLTSTFARPSLDADVPHAYARISHPTREALERNLAVLEGGTEACAFASGMAAIDAVFSLLQAGDHAIVSENAYGGTYRLCERVLAGRGLRFSWIDTSNLGAVERAVTPATRMLFTESPTNPMMTLTDLAAASEMCRRRGLIHAVDNTFLSPYLQRPLELGADVVVHSATKFLNGHSDVVGGVAVCASAEHARRLRFVQGSAGAVPGPLDCYLVLRGLKTLALRMERHDRNGRAVAGFLDGHPKVRAVRYPGLASHPQHDLARRQQRGFGSLLAFDLGSRDAAGAFLGGLELCTLAESLGGVETLISHPASMSHASLPGAERVRLGITDGLLRLSVGIEDLDDILDDLRSGLSRL
jgi:cystathionine beta-lyase/cystathionine gamma-synthase